MIYIKSLKGEEMTAKKNQKLSDVFGITEARWEEIAKTMIDVITENYKKLPEGIILAVKKVDPQTPGEGMVVGYMIGTLH